MVSIEEIRNNWNSDIIGQAQKIQSLDGSKHPAWTIKIGNTYGVAIPYSGDRTINEYFASARFQSDMLPLLNEKASPALVLRTYDQDIADTFATLCADLVDPGENGVKRTEIEADPVQWWKKWKKIVGNKNYDQAVYDTLGELYVLKLLREKNLEPVWNGPKAASYDIELDNCFIEVKSTIVRDRKEVTISSQFQLNPPDRPLYLVLCQMEETFEGGESIDSIVAWFESVGLNTKLLNDLLKSKGFEIGMSARKKTFIIHDVLKYFVDDNFPRITPQSFKGDVLPAGITKISYTVDLSCLTPVSMLGQNDVGPLVSASE